MIIYLKGANFADSNIGTLSTWTISRVLGTGATYSGVTSVDKDAAFSATVTIADGYEIGSAGVTVTMGGVAGDYATVSDDGLTVTISIASVTGNVKISVPTVNTSTGEEGGSHFEDDETAIDLTATATESGTIYKYTGDTTTSSYVVAKVVDVSSYVGKMLDFTFIKYTSSSSGQTSWACGFLDSDSNFTLIQRVSKSSSGEASTGELELLTDIVIPTGVQYITIPWFNETAVSEGCYSGSTSDFEIRVKDAGTLVTEDITDEFTTWTTGAIKYSTGETMTSSVMQYNDYVDISDAESLTLKFMTWTSSSGTQANYGLAFYDSSKTYISGYQCPLGSSGNSAGESYDLTVSVPSNATYIRTTYHSDADTYGAFSARKSYYA